MVNTMGLASTDTLSGTAAAVGSVKTRWVDRAVVVVSGLTSETVAVTGLLSGSVYTADLRPINLTTGVVEASDSNLSNGSFLFDNLAYDELKFTKSAATETITITVRTA